MSEHPSHNISDYFLRCYGCGCAVGTPAAAEECPTPDNVGRQSWADVRAKAHAAIQREFAPPSRDYFGPGEEETRIAADLWDREGRN